MNNKLFYEITLSENEIIKLLVSLDKEINTYKNLKCNEETAALEKLRNNIEKQKRAADLA